MITFVFDIYSTFSKNKCKLYIFVKVAISLVFMFLISLPRLISIATSLLIICSSRGPALEVKYSSRFFVDKILGAKMRYYISFHILYTQLTSPVFFYWHICIPNILKIFHPTINNTTSCYIMLHANLISGCIHLETT